MKIAFRADASVQIGTGHIMRCLALADELTREGHQCLFICRDHSGHQGELIESKGYECHLLVNSLATESPVKPGIVDLYAQWLGVPWQQDARQTRELLAPMAVDWLVVDHYALDIGWEQELATFVGRIMVIDDLADRDHECSLLLDQNLGREIKDYKKRVPDNCRLVVGPQYALLRPEFAQLRERSLQRRRYPELKRLLISFGGVDRSNVTGQLLEALVHTDLTSEIELDIIMGGSAPYLQDVRKQAAQLPFQATVSVNVTDMAKRMCLADLSVGAAGSTSWERCCLGLPAMVVILAENQRFIGNALEQSGSALLLDESHLAEQLKKLIRQLIESDTRLSELSENAAKVCDGDGCIRMVAAMTESEYL